MSRPRSRDRFVRSIIAQAVCVNANHSLSPGLRAMGICVEQIFLRKRLPCIKMLHVVDLLVLKQPAWLLSLQSLCESRHLPGPSQPLKLPPTSITWSAHQASDLLARNLHTWTVFRQEVRTLMNRNGVFCPKAAWSQCRWSSSQAWPPTWLSW